MRNLSDLPTHQTTNVKLQTSIVDLKRFVIHNFKNSLAETANRADSGQLQFWSEPSEILNLLSSNTPETVAFTIP
jgi:hypothetical protein